jgi:hypothetical protein
MNRLSIYDYTLFITLQIPQKPITKAQLSRFLQKYCKENGLSVIEMETGSNYINIDSSLAKLTGLPMDTKYYFWKEGVRVNEWGEVVSKIQAKMWRGWVSE